MWIGLRWISHDNAVRRLLGCGYAVFSNGLGYLVQHLTDGDDVSHCYNLAQLVGLAQTCSSGASSDTCSAAGPRKHHKALQGRHTEGLISIRRDFISLMHGADVRAHPRQRRCSMTLRQEGCVEITCMTTDAATQVMAILAAAGLHPRQDLERSAPHSNSNSSRHWSLRSCAR